MSFAASTVWASVWPREAPLAPLPLAGLARIAAARETDHRGQTSLNAITLPTALPLTIIGDAIPLPLSGEGLLAILKQLIDNAANHGATTVVLTAEPGALIIADDGTGVSDGNRTRVFDPFFTTRREKGGTGMGLAIVSALLRANGGQVELFENQPGAMFRVTWSGR